LVAAIGEATDTPCNAESYFVHSGFTLWDVPVRPAAQARSNNGGVNQEAEPRPASLCSAADSSHLRDLDHLV
jgi:hypothetical protein